MTLLVLNMRLFQALTIIVVSGSYLNGYYTRSARASLQHDVDNIP